jgi:hypothetical protein
MTLRRRLRGTPTALVALAAVAVLVGVGAAGQSRADPTSPAPTPPTITPVASTDLVCPAPIASGTTLATTITAAVAAVPGVPAGPSAEPSLARVLALGGAAPVPKLIMTQPDQAGGYRVTGRSTGPVLASATGSLAPGLVADQLTRGANGRFRGLAAVPCGPALTDAWFIGGGSTLGRATQVFLSNVDDQPAQVDLLLYGTGGPISAPGAQGIVVAPRSRTVLSLTNLAPGQPLVALHVIARAGRVSPAVLDNTVNGLVPQGLEYLSLTSAQRRVVIPGVLSGPGTRSLMLLAPDADATVKASVLTTDGSLTQVGLTSFALAAGKVTRVSLDKVLHGQAVGLVLSSDKPIVAGVHAVLSGTISETADTAGTPRLDTVGMVSGLLPLQRNSLEVAAPDGAGALQIMTHKAGRAGVVSTRTVTVPAGSSLRVALPSVPGAAWTWIVVQPAPGSGPLYVTRVTVEGAARGILATMAPVLPLRPLTSIPASVYRVGLDDR